MRAVKIISLLLVALVTVVSAETAPEYTAAEAGKHIGETASVTGTADRVSKASGGNVFINMGKKDAADSFTIFIAAKNAEAVGDVAQYEGKTITVSGKIASHKDKPEIVVTAASQITLKEGGDATASPSPSAAAKE